MDEPIHFIENIATATETPCGLPWSLWGEMPKRLDGPVFAATSPNKVRGCKPCVAAALVAQTRVSEEQEEDARITS